MSGEMPVDEVEQLEESLDRVDLVNLIDLEAQLLDAQLPDHVLERGDVETGLVTEVVIDHAGVRARALADSFDPRPAVTVGRELAVSGAEDLFSGSVCIPLSAVHRGKNTSQTTDWLKARAAAVSALRVDRPVVGLSLGRPYGGATSRAQSAWGRECNAEVSRETFLSK